MVEFTRIHNNLTVFRSEMRILNLPVEDLQDLKLATVTQLSRGVTSTFEAAAMLESLNTLIAEKINRSK